MKEASTKYLLHPLNELPFETDNFFFFKYLAIGDYPTAVILFESNFFIIIHTLEIRLIFVWSSDTGMPCVTWIIHSNKWLSVMIYKLLKQTLKLILGKKHVYLYDPHCYISLILKTFSSLRIIQNIHWKCSIRHEANPTLNLIT